MSQHTADVITKSMRSNKVTIAQLAFAMNITKERVRDVRNGADCIAIRDWLDGIQVAADMNKNPHLYI